MPNSDVTKKKEGDMLSPHVFTEDFIKELRRMYWTEKHLVTFLAKAQRAASTNYLKACFKGHRLATGEHVKRLETIFSLLNKKPFAKLAGEVEGLISEGTQLLKLTEKNTLSRDLGLISVIQKIERLESRKYNSLINLANELGNYSVNLLLEESLAEEQEAEETFGAVMTDTLNDERFKIQLPEDPEEEVMHLEAV